VLREGWGTCCAVSAVYCWTGRLIMGRSPSHCWKLATVSLPKACSLLPAKIVVAFSRSPFFLIVSVTARLLPSSICSDRFRHPR
jgi:hypothetical protein